ncbi:phenylacetate--CoA ligase family protein [Arthrobacter globiformis]|uniref:phenylacetate--CoA ligase family protein n=1 Tax=Arthrobacter globiformis TaxID=1665 RepID=UPI000B411A1B|nr:phenylacetate--CoA ligase family protein [Arthrobacter globiformis]
MSVTGPLGLTAGIAWDLHRASRAGRAGISARQTARLGSLLADARSGSPYYRDRLVGVDGTDLTGVAPSSKQELMANFDRWFADPAIRWEVIQEFIADPRLIGEPFLGRYAVWTSSGTTGTPGVFVHDAEAQAVYQALVARLYASAVSWQLIRRRLRGRRRTAAVFVTGGHYAGAAGMARAQRQHPRLAAGARLFSALAPLPQLVTELNEFAPSLLAGYPSALDLLAAEQTAGRLRLRPALLLASGERLAPASRHRIEAAFGCPVRDSYGASEFPGMAYDCGHGWLHLHADWLVLEAVDAELRPVPPGELSDTALLTNLANRVQPLIRYDLGDRVLFSPDPCQCGSPLPALRVEGRTNDTLTFPAAGGGTTRVLPLALITVVEDTPGVRRCQIIQTAPATLLVRLETEQDAEPSRLESVWAAVSDRLRGYLRQHQVAEPTVERAAETPQPDPRSGKLRQVYTALPANGASAG